MSPIFHSVMVRWCSTCTDLHPFSHPASQTRSQFVMLSDLLHVVGMCLLLFC